MSFPSERLSMANRSCGEGDESIIILNFYSTAWSGSGTWTFAPVPADLDRISVVYALISKID